MATISEALAIAVGHHRAGRLEMAEQIYRRILVAEPDHAEALHLLGVIAQQTGKHVLAIQFIQRSIALDGGQPLPYNNLGEAYRAVRQTADAIACYRRALQLKPDFAGAHHNLGNALRDQGRFDEAVACYRRALELQPEQAQVFFELGNVFRLQRKVPETIACYRRAVQLQPCHGAALGALVHQLQWICRWDGAAGIARRLIEAVDEDAQGVATAVPPLQFLIQPAVTTAAQQLRCARQWVRRRLEPPAAAGEPASRRPPHSKPKITVGYLSGDFHAHATAWLTAELFEKHDRGGLEVFAYSYGPDDGSPMRRRLANAFDRFVDVKDASFVEAARRIAADGVDILVDLKGYAWAARPEILAPRPAPIQVNYLGYPGTMGASFIDYIVVDDFIVPPQQHPFFTEKLVHLPGCYQVNDSRREIAPGTPVRAEYGLPDDGFVFCCVNSSYKITAEMFDVWMRLLGAVPGSVLWLLDCNPLVPGNLRREAEARGVAGERLVFAPLRTQAEHLRRLALADLFLDTFPVNAHTTASDSLWAGCPLLTLTGETFVSRVAGSLLCDVGLGELITTSLEDYEALALRLARDADRLRQLRARLAANRKTAGLFDASRFVRNLEKAYRTMWEIYAGGQPPRAFAVSET